MMLARYKTIAIAIAAFALLVSACASVPAYQRVESDPWESLNQPLFAVNQGFDKALTKPLAKGYRAILPGPVRKVFTNFFTNLTTPIDREQFLAR